MTVKVGSGSVVHGVEVDAYPGALAVHEDTEFRRVSPSLPSRRLPVRVVSIEEAHRHMVPMRHHSVKQPAQFRWDQVVVMELDHRTPSISALHDSVLCLL